MGKKSMEEIYDMKLGDRIEISVFDVWRVPGGWLFGCDTGKSGVLQFVPFSVESDIKL